MQLDLLINDDYIQIYIDYVIILLLSIKLYFKKNIL